MPGDPEAPAGGGGGGERGGGEKGGRERGGGETGGGETGGEGATGGKETPAPAPSTDSPNPPKQNKPHSSQSSPANGAGNSSGNQGSSQPHNRHQSTSPHRPSVGARANSNPKANHPPHTGPRDRVPGFNAREQGNSVWSNRQREREREKERRESEWESRSRRERKWDSLQPEEHQQQRDLSEDRTDVDDVADLYDEFQDLSLHDQPISNPPSARPSSPLPPFPRLPGAEGSVPYNWQANKGSVKERLAFMFNSEVMTDVKFVVGKGTGSQRIPAHKFVLSIGSAVFDAMFNGAMATKQPEIELPDIEPAAFLAMLRFLYTDEVNIGPDTVMTTLYTAKKYAVPALERACVDFLKRNLSSDNAFVLLTQARLFDEPQLAALCLETIDKNTTEALGAEGFTDIDLDTLCVVLERDTLGIRECKLFSALCRWAEAECNRQGIAVNDENQRSVLGRALTLIRFPLMTVEEFALGAAQSHILTDREVVQLFLHFTVNPKPAVNFVDTPRCCLTGKEQVVSRFLQIESRWGYSGTSDRIRFMVNRRIFVVGFGLYGSIHGPSEYVTNIQIIHTETGKMCGSSDTTFASDGSTSTFRVMFKEPVEIQANTNYIACATLKGPDSYYGTKGLRKVTHESVSSGKVTFQFTYAAGNNNGTSVEDGQLPEIIFYT